MKIFKKWHVYFMLITSTVILNACNNSNADNTKLAIPNNQVQQKTGTIEHSDTKNITSLQVELDQAKNDRKAVFVVVTSASVTNIDKATTIAKEANVLYKNAVVVQLNRDDAANAPLVAEWRLAGAPLPLILVLSSKGKPSGGYILEQATAKNIAALVPSPKLEMVYEAIGNNRNAIVVFSKKSFADRDETIKIGKQAVSMLKGDAEFIEVDMDDIKEINFMNQLRIDKASTKASVTLVINKQGQVAGTSKTIPEASKLVAAAKTPVKSGCGPGCGPAGCEK